MRDYLLFYSLGKGISEVIKGNNRVSELLAGQNAQQAAAEAENQLREKIFQVRKDVQSAAQLLEANPAKTLYLMLDINQWLRENGVTESSLSQIADKETVHETRQAIEQLIAASREKTSSDSQVKIERAVKAKSTVSTLLGLLAWETIIRLMVPKHMLAGGRFVWGGISGILYFAGLLFGLFIYSVILLAFIGALIFGGRNPDAGTVFIFLGALGVSLVGTPMLVRMRKRIAEKCNKLASFTGGFFTECALHKDVREIVHLYRNTAQSKGIPVDRLSLQELKNSYQQEASLLADANSEFQLSLNLSVFPSVSEFD